MLRSRATSLLALLAVAALAAGAAAMVADQSEIGLVAGVIGAVTAGIGVVADRRLVASDRTLVAARTSIRQLQRRLEALGDHDPKSATDPPAADLDGPTDFAHLETDRVSGMYLDDHLPVVLHHNVATARRQVQPISVIFWEVDGLVDAGAAVHDQAMAALGAVARHALRESDAMFRVGGLAAVALLTDTTEAGARFVADRVRTELRDSPIGGSLTVSAGIACYPTHALEATALVDGAGLALRTAREQGHTRDHVAIAAGD